jgi:predicted peroxiredoxin
MEQKDMVVLLTVDPKKDLERASMGLSIANAALATDVKVKIFFALDGIFTLVKGHCEGLKADHFASVQELLDLFAEEGGELHACSPFMAQRNISEGDLVDGVIISSAPTLVHDASGGVITI